MNYRELFKIEDLYGAFLFCGVEKLLSKNTEDFIYKKYISGPFQGLNYNRLKAPFEKDLISAALTLPVMGKKRLVIVEDSKTFSEQNLSDEFYDFLKDIPKSTIIIFKNGEEINKRKKILQKFFGYRTYKI